MTLNRKVRIGVRVLHPGLRMTNQAVIDRVADIPKDDAKESNELRPDTAYKQGTP